MIKNKTYRQDKKDMKILLDFGFGYFINAKTGVGKYEGNIIWGLQTEYDIVVPQKYTASLPSNANPVTFSSFRKRFSKLMHLLFSADSLYGNYDVVIMGTACYRKSKKVKQIPIVHDLMCFTEPENYSFGRRFGNRIAARTLKNAYKLIAVSNTTKQVLHDLFKISFNKIVVLPNVTDFYIQRKSPADFIFIGDMRKNKNLDYLIKGFAKFKEDCSGNERLIIAGNKSFEYEKLIECVRQHHQEKNIVFLGYVSEYEKIELFSNSKGLVFISDNEGFGIPLLEANVNGIPVLCSDIPVFHEVVTEKGCIFIDNKDVASIADGIKKLKDYHVDEEYRKELKEKYSMSVFAKLLNIFIAGISEK